MIRHRPEIAGAVVIGAAWIALAFMSGAHGQGPVQWITMSTAMMGPAVLPALRYTAVNSLAWRRRRAVLEFSVAYLSVWLAFGWAATMVIGDWSPPFAFPATLAAAALWTLSSLREPMVRACHRGIPLPPDGWPAERESLRFGIFHGAACVGSCWPLMVAMLVAPGGHLPLAAALTALIAAERFAERPRRAARRSAGLLVLAALSSAAFVLQ